ncbi:hypothetical protein KUCAC02_005655, partial [Chaenocephalus aceratus]
GAVTELEGGSQGVELEKIVPAALTAQILTTGFVGTDAAALGRSQSEEAAGGLWTQCAAASESLMEEGGNRVRASGGGAHRHAPRNPLG